MRRGVFWAVLFALAAAACVAVMAWARLSAGSGTALVSREGELLHTIDLSAVDSPYTITVQSGGGYNVLTVERGRVCVSEADCPDQTCVRQGWISDSALPIVCLPHGLVVEITGGGKADSVT